MASLYKPLFSLAEYYQIYKLFTLTRRPVGLCFYSVAHPGVTEMIPPLTNLIKNSGVTAMFSRKPLASNSVVVHKLRKGKRVELGHQNCSTNRHDTVYHSVLSKHGDILFAGNRRDSFIKSHTYKSVGGTRAKQRRRQEPQSWAACCGRRVCNMQQTSVGAELGLFELEELKLACRSDMAKGPRAAGDIAGKTEPHAIHGTIGRGHPNGRAAYACRNRDLRRLTTCSVDAHNGRVGVLRDVDQSGDGLPLNEHRTVEALVQCVVRGIRDIC